MKAGFAIVLATLVTSHAFSQEAAPKASGASTATATPPDAAGKVATPSDAVGWVIADLAKLDAESRPFVRYIWIPPWGKPEWHAAISFAVNTAANRGSLVRRPVILANGYLVRWDLRQLAPKAEELKTLIELWDGLAVDEPYFHVPKVNKVERVVVKQVRNQRGQLVNQNVTVSEDAKVAVVAPHIKAEHAKLLTDLNVSPAICYRAEWIIGRLLTTTDGGKYYEFRGIIESPDEKRTDQEHFLAQFGAFEQLSKQLNGDQRAAMFRSNVTGKPRRVDGFRGVAGRFGTGQVWVTHDIRDGDVKIDQHPIYNLLKFNDAAREIILEANNGLHVFALFDDKGKLQREVPPDVAKDHTIPAPNTARLNAALSCIVCHGPDSGLRDAPNEVRTLLKGRLDAFDDFANLKGSRFENIDRLAGLYAGRFERRIRLGRDDYEEATQRATAGMKVPDVSALLGQIFYGWKYEMVSPRQAALELGFEVTEDKAAAFLQQNVKDYPAETQSGIAFEDVAVAALRQGMKIRRIDFDRVFADMMIRLEETRK